MINMMKELISVIIPVFNAEKYISKCLKCVTEQTYKNIEIIIIDDGSKDDTASICYEFKNSDSRIKIFHKENGGVSSARNYGITKSKGKFLFFLDSDDLIEPNAIYELYNKIIKTNSDIAISNYDNITINNSKIINKIKEYNDFQNFICMNYLWAPWGKLIKKENEVSNEVI